MHIPFERECFGQKEDDVDTWKLGQEGRLGESVWLRDIGGVI